MNTPQALSLKGVFKLLIVTMLLSNAFSVSACGSYSDSTIFVGTTPCGPGVRPFLGVSTESDCAQVKWHILLHRDTTNGSPTTFTLQTIHGFIDLNTNLILQKETNTFHGDWIINLTKSSRPGETVYELKSDKTGVPLRLKMVDENILQILTTKGTMMIGDEFQSYTLNALNRPSPPQSKLLTKGEVTSSESHHQPISGTFRGRTPCQEISAQVGLQVRDECAKRKLVLTLDQDPATHQPTTFRMRGMGDNFTEGKWKIIDGSNGAPIYQLTATGSEKSLLLLRGDDNVLFFVKNDHSFLVGNANYSYTLNRQEQPAKYPGYVAP